MNITKRILSTLLAIAMVLSTFTVLFTVQVSAATTGTETETEEKTAIKDYVTKVYNNPEEKLQTMELMRTVGNYQLWVDRRSGEVAWVETDAQGNPTENILFTNPYDVASSKGSKTTKQELLSQIIVSFTDTTGTSKQLYSYTDAALNDQITVNLIKGGVRVEYIIGREDGRKLIPKLIYDDSFQTNILDNIRKAAEPGGALEFEQGGMAVEWFVNAWQEYNPNKMSQGMRMEMIKRYPALGETYTDENGNTVYPILWSWYDKMSNVADTLRREAWIKTYCPDYTFEQLDADHEATGYVAQDEKYPVFKMALEYYLDEENGLTVRLPCNGLRYDAATYTLQNLTVLPYMGASNYKNAGVTIETDTGTKTLENYTFFPDGSGALFDHAELGNSTEKLLGYVYGEDYAYHQLIGLKFHKAVRYPVYGIVSSELFYEYSYSTGKDDNGKDIMVTERVSCTVKTEEQLRADLEAKNIFLKKDAIKVVSYQRGYAAFVESADSFTRLQLYHGGALHNYSTVFPYFNPKASDTYSLSGSIASSAESVGISSDRKYTGSFTLHYVMLTDDTVAAQNKLQNPAYKYYNASWLGMAEAYRDHLTKTGKLSTQLTANDVEEDLPLYIEVFGALKTKETIATIPVWVMTPLTTFENVLTMYTELSDPSRNVKNINFKLTGFANGGMYSTMPYKLNWEKNVGGSKGFEELIAAADEINNKNDGSHLGLYPDFDFAYVQSDTAFDGMNLKKDAVKTLDNRYTSYRYYDASIQSFASFYKLAISPARYSRFYEKLLSNYEQYGLGSMSVGSLGNTLNSDFDEDDPYNREQSKDFTQQALADIQSAGYSLMTDGGNAYTWAYVDHILNVELDSSRYLISSATVPFVGSVLHGYVQFAGAPLNEEGDVNYAILRAIENGAGLYFILSYQNTTELKEDAQLNGYYSIRYDIWLEDVAKYYNQLNTVLKDVQTKVIINHEFLVGERILDLDELEADIENKLEDAILNQDKVQSNFDTSEAVAAAEAWNLLYNAEATMQGMLAEVESINAEIAKRITVKDGKVWIIRDGANLNKLTYKDNLLDFAPVLNNNNNNLGSVGGGAGVIPKYIATLVDSNNSSSYKSALEQVESQFAELRKVTMFLAQSSVDLKDIKARTEGILDEMDAALELIKTTPVYNDREDVRAMLVADCEARIQNVENYIEDIVTGCDRYTVTAGKDYLNSESDVYFLDPAVEAVEEFFDINFQEGGRYYEYYKDGGQFYIDFQDKPNIDKIKTISLAKIQQELLAKCPTETMTKEYILSAIENPEEEEEEVVEVEPTNNNRVVAVTYGDRDANTFEKTPYKTIILNYNSYAVRVTYNGTLYTVPSGGYVVINYND